MATKKKKKKIATGLDIPNNNTHHLPKNPAKGRILAADKNITAHYFELFDNFLLLLISFLNICTNCLSHLNIWMHKSSYGGFYPGFHLHSTGKWKKVSSASTKFNGSYLCYVPLTLKLATNTRVPRIACKITTF